MARVVWTLCALALLTAGTSSFRPVAAEDEVDLAQALSTAARRDVPLDERLAAVTHVLASDTVPDPESTLRAGIALLREAPEPACWLVLRATDAGHTSYALRREAARTIGELLGSDEQDAATRARLAACGLIVHRREGDMPAAVTGAWPPSAFVRAVLEREIGHWPALTGPVEQASAKEVRAILAECRAVAGLLDSASEDDPELMQLGLDALVERGAAAVPLLLHEARLGARGWPVGRMPRAARAIVALGFLGDRAATPVLADGLASTDGWVRVAAATALGDLGDPAGAVALAVYLRTMGDLFRDRDQWEYPGASETSIPERDWRSIDYYAVDCAAADALLRLGVPRATGFLIHEKLDPSKRHFRIRVLQDAVDALRRSVRGAPIAAYNVDAGLPQRTDAFLALARWWHGRRDDPSLLATRLDERDAAFRKAARVLAVRLLGKDVRQFMIAKPAIELLGPPMTPTLVETLAQATSGPARSELAQALALVRDPRAIPALLGLLTDRRPFVRGAAATALAPYVDGSAEVRAALLGMLQDPKEGPRVSALKALVAAPPTDDVLTAVVALGKRMRAGGRTPSASYAMVERVVLLVQEGERHWPTVAAGLKDTKRFTREGWWSLLRAALQLPAWLHDAKAPPDARSARRVSEAQVLAALHERRAR